MRILCVHIETSSLWAEFVNKSRCISGRLVSKEVKSIKFDNLDNSPRRNSVPKYFYVKDESHVRLWDPFCVHITAQRQYTAVYKRCVHLWNNFPCIITLISGFKSCGSDAPTKFKVFSLNLGKYSFLSWILQLELVNFLIKTRLFKYRVTWNTLTVPLTSN